MVKCADCGYLGVRHIENQTLVSPGEEQRRTGSPPTIEQGGTIGGRTLPVLDTRPVCAVRAFPLDEELLASVSAKDVMQKDRPCGRSTPWIPGLTPKEHIDMIATQAMLDANLKAQKEQAQRERDWRKEDMKIASDNLKAARGNTTVQWCATMLALIVAICSGGWSIWTTWHTPPAPTAATAPANPAKAK